MPKSKATARPARGDKDTGRKKLASRCHVLLRSVGAACRRVIDCLLVKHPKAAFTLLELLVVIAIVSVLAGLFLPVYGRVQEKANAVKCTSNLKQIATGLLGFAGDHNGLCPLSGAVISYQQGADPATPGLGWTQQLEPYAGGTGKGIYVCPSSSKMFPANKQYSYFQGCHAAYVANNDNFAALRLSLLAAPSKYILAGDISSNEILSEATDADKDDFTQDPAFDTTPCPFHGGKANVVFADGHCAAFAAFDARSMTTHYDLKSDGTGYSYNE